jgi:hypothetical protein
MPPVVFMLRLYGSREISARYETCGIMGAKSGNMADGVYEPMNGGFQPEA